MTKAPPILSNAVRAIAGLIGARNRQSRDVHDRVGGYGRYLRAYQGYSIRGAEGSTVVREWKRVKFNFNEPVIDLSAGFFASKPIGWDIAGDPDATAEAFAIWDRSGSDRDLLRAAKACCIYGDMVAVSAAGASGPVIEFADPCIVYPLFDGADYNRIHSAEISYHRTNAEGNEVLYREEWGPSGMVAFEDDTQVKSLAYDQMPLTWIRNASVMGLPFGISDLHGIWDLTEEYDHICSKQTRIIDYYAAPTLAFRGITSGELKKQTNTTIFLPTDGDAFFVEWKGSPPDVESHLTRIRNAISEKSRVPAVAFGQQDSGLSAISGVALQILYGPLISKTNDKRSEWGPALERAMWLCLRSLPQFAALELTQVNVVWPNPLPSDDVAQVSNLNTQVSGQIKSRRTAMSELGITDPNAEMKRIVVEDRLLSLASPPTPAVPQFGPDGQPLPAPEGPADTTEQVSDLLERFDDIIEQEDAAMADDLNEQRQQDGDESEPAE